MISTQNNYIGVNMARGKDKLKEFKEYLAVKAVKDAETDYGVVADGPLKGYPLDKNGNPDTVRYALEKQAREDSNRVSFARDEESTR